MSIGNRAGQRALVAGCVIGYWSMRAVMAVGAVTTDVDFSQDLESGANRIDSGKIWKLAGQED